MMAKWSKVLPLISTCLISITDTAQGKSTARACEKDASDLGSGVGVGGGGWRRQQQSKNTLSSPMGSSDSGDTYNRYSSR